LATEKTFTDKEPNHYGLRRLQKSFQSGVQEARHCRVRYQLYIEVLVVRGGWHTGRGAFYRVGGDRQVEAIAGDAISGKPADGASQSSIVDSANSEASMAIRAGELVKMPEKTSP
jgi:hypothetical protein